MSHFTRLKTRLKVREHLIAALEDLGYECEEGTVEVRGFGGNRTSVDIRVRTKSAGYDIGFRRNGGGYELVADWWGIREWTQESFLGAVTQRYAYRAARAALEQEQDFSLVSEEVDEDGRIRLVLRRMV
jgi:hypothetical protein